MTFMDLPATSSHRGGLTLLAAWASGVRLRHPVIGHGPDPGVTRCTSVTTSPSPTIRCTSPERAAWSGSSARRVVVSGPVVTLQSSNCARSVLPAWPLKVTSYVCGRTGITPRSWWLTLAVRVPGARPSVVTRCRVIRGLMRWPRAGPHRQQGPAGLGSLHPLLSCLPSAAPMLTRIKRSRRSRCRAALLAIGMAGWDDAVARECARCCWLGDCARWPVGRRPAGSCRTKRWPVM